MSDIALIFCKEMIQAFLDGRKTMTRRTRGLEVVNENPDKWVLFPSDGSGDFRFYSQSDDVIVRVKCRYPVGDRVYVKETWAVTQNYDGLKPSEIPHSSPIWWYADELEHVQWGHGRQRSAMFMPEWAARIWREITAVRCERVQDIEKYPEDFKAEGYKPIMLNNPKGELVEFSCDSAWFESLWDRLNSRKYPWKLNPWVWVLTLIDKKEAQE